MRRRLTLAMVGCVAVALAAAGLGTALLVRAGARDEARQQLEEQAAALAEFADESGRPVAQFYELRLSLDIDGLEFLVIRPDGQLSGPLPAGVEGADLDTTRLRAGVVLSGERGERVWAAAAVARPQRTALVVITRQVDALDADTARWFTVMAALTLALAVLVALRLATGLTRQLRLTEATTGKMAAGDLAARVPIPDRRDEVGDLARSVNQLAAALERSQGVERSFLLSVSHDLRTPLTAIAGWAEALADGVAPDPAEAGRHVQREARRLERLVDDLLELARLRAGRFSLHLEPTPVDRVAAEVVASTQPVAEAAGVVLRTIGPPAGGTAAPATATADPERVAQALANLVDNGLRHARSRVTVAVTADGTTVAIAVDDDGAGIAPEDRAQVFERFWSAEGGHGSGVGLAVVAELARAMGGSVEAGAADLGGARLVLRLPRA